MYDLKATGVGKAFESGTDAGQIQKQIRHSDLKVIPIINNK